MKKYLFTLIMFISVLANSLQIPQIVIVKTKLDKQLVSEIIQLAKLDAYYETKKDKVVFVIYTNEEQLKHLKLVAKLINERK